MKRVVLNLAAVLGVIMLVLATGQAAMANAVIDFGTGSAGGSAVGAYTFSGGVAAGVNIPIGIMNFQNPPTIPTPGVNYTVNGALTCLQVNGCAALNFNTSTGNITITGYITALGVGSSSSLVTLLTGTITSFTASSVSFNATGPDTKAPALLTALDLPTNSQFAYMEFNFAANGGVVSSTDVSNTAVPEPGTLVMFGSGLLGLAGLIRRKLSA